MNHGLYPATVKSYNAASKTCQITLTGVTDGTARTITAHIAYPIGDVSTHTDIAIHGGDLVWVMFEGGDMRHPIITHFRNRAVGNETDWRRWAHENMALSAGGILLIKATAVQIESESLTHNGINISANHTHGGVAKGGARTNNPA
jgi:hypothetical protein